MAVRDHRADAEATHIGRRVARAPVEDGIGAAQLGRGEVFEPSVQLDRRSWRAPEHVRADAGVGGDVTIARRVMEGVVDQPPFQDRLVARGPYRNRPGRRRSDRAGEGEGDQRQGNARPPVRGERGDRQGDHRPDEDDVAQRDDREGEEGKGDEGGRQRGRGTPPHPEPGEESRRNAEIGDRKRRLESGAPLRAGHRDRGVAEARQVGEELVAERRDEQRRARCEDAGHRQQADAVRGDGVQGPQLALEDEAARHDSEQQQAGHETSVQVRPQREQGQRHGHRPAKPHPWRGVRPP